MLYNTVKAVLNVFKKGPAFTRSCLIIMGARFTKQKRALFVSLSYAIYSRNKDTVNYKKDAYTVTHFTVLNISNCPAFCQVKNPDYLYRYYARSHGMGR